VGLTDAVATAWVPACNGLPYAILPTTGGVFVGGAFTTPRLRVAKYDKNGTVLAWTANADNVVLALGIAGTTLYMGGDFLHVAGQPRSRLAAAGVQTGTLGAWNPGADSTVRALAPTGGGVFIGGSFATVATQLRGGAAAVDAAGKLLDWDPALVGDVKTLLPYGPQTAIGGSFATVEGVPHAFLALVGPGVRTTDVPLRHDTGRVALGPVAPNPVRTAGRVRFTLERPARVSLALFDLAGRRARQLVDGTLLAPGDHDAAISSAGLSPGVYFLRLEAGSEAVMRSVVLVR